MPRRPSSGRPRQTARAKRPPGGSPATGGGKRFRVAAATARGTARDRTEPDGVPTRWVKFVAALLLLPWIWVYAQAFFNVFTDSAVHHAFWQTEEFWFFSLGLVLWLIVFFGLPRPVRVYVFGHELTHALWVWAMGGRVSRFHVGRDGGQIVTDTSNFWIALAPYFFPVYAVALILVYGIVGLFHDLEAFRRLLFALVGAAWGFHATFTVWMIPKGQSDIEEHGHFFSYVIIFTLNLAVLTVLFITASPEVTWQSFGRELLHQAIDVSSAIVGALESTVGRALP